MAKLGNYNIPKEYKDEDKWFRFFTKVQLLFIGAAAGISIGLIVLFNKLNATPVGVVLTVVTLIVAVILAFVNIPANKYMTGGGLKLRTMLLRLIIKRQRKNRVLYVKNYDLSDEGV